MANEEEDYQISFQPEEFEAKIAELAAAGKYANCPGIIGKDSLRKKEAVTAILFSASSNQLRGPPNDRYPERFMVVAEARILPISLFPQINFRFTTSTTPTRPSFATDKELEWLARAMPLLIEKKNECLLALGQLYELYEADAWVSTKQVPTVRAPTFVSLPPVKAAAVKTPPKQAKLS